MTKTLIRKDENIQCNECHEIIPYLVKKKKLYGEFEHIYAECESCGYKKTVYYTNKKLRKLLTKQANEKNYDKKLILKDKIEQEIELLNIKFEK